MKSQLIFKIFFIFLIFSATVCFAIPSSSINKDKNPYRRGADIGKPAEFLLKEVWPEITKYYTPFGRNSCAKYELIGLCYRPLFDFRLMFSYYVPFDLTEHSNRPGASRLATKPVVKAILSTASETLQATGGELSKANSDLLESVQGKDLLGIGEKDDGAKETLDKNHDKDIDFGDLGVEGKAQTPMYSSLFDSGFNNFVRVAPGLKQIYDNKISPFAWCHENTANAHNKKRGMKPLLPMFSDLGPKALLYTYFRMMTYANQDFKKMVLGPNEIQNCDGERRKTGKVPEEIFEIKEKINLINYETDDEKCPGDGNAGPFGFTMYTNSLYRAFTSLLKSAAILYKAWYLDKANQNKRHHLKVRHDQSEEKGRAHHLQIIWPKPDKNKRGEAWAGGCRDTKVKEGSGPQSHYAVPKLDMPTDYIKASQYDNENTEDKNHDLFIFAHYTNVSCCPAGYIPIVFKSGYEKRKLR